MIRKTVISKSEIESIFNQHFNSLCLFARRYLKSATIVEDVVQDVFVSLWEKQIPIKTELAIKTYLYTAVRNKCLNELKHQKVIQKHEQDLIYQLESEQFFLNHVIEEEVYNKLINEIQNLPKNCKEITLLALQGLKNQDIAEELNVSVNTIKTQKKIAYQKIRLELKGLLSSIFLAL